MPKPKAAAQPNFENKLGGSTGWRQSRTMKLSHQFKSGGTGGARISDQVGAGSEDWDEKAKALIPKEVRERAKNSVEDMLVGQAKIPMTSEEKLMAQRKKEDDLKEQQKLNRQKGIFDGLVIYINENGGRISIHLGRKKVTHVILGKPAGTQGSGAGGGLAGGKMEKEIRRIGGCGVKYVGVEWVLESLKLGKRLSETQFSNLKVAAKGQQSIYGMFKKTSSTGSTETQ